MSASLEKIAIFIDGANLYATSKALGFDIDYKKMLRYYRTQGYLVRAYYYTAVDEAQEYSSIRPLLDWLDYNGYRVVTKPTKSFVNDQGARKVKGNMDVELCVDMLELASSVDHIILFSGDGDFRSAVDAVQRKGRKVTVVSTISTQPSMVADELRRQADDFQDLVGLRVHIEKTDSSPARAPRDIRGSLPSFVSGSGEESDTDSDDVDTTPRPAKRPVAAGKVT